jgi:CheY-like chemotaxis protein
VQARDGRGLSRWSRRFRHSTLSDVTVAEGLRVVVADDHATFRRQACALLVSCGWAVVGQAASGEEAVAVAEAEQPDVLVLDVMLGDMDGFEVAERLHGSVWPLGIVLISAYEAETFATRLARMSGDGVVAGFVAKSDFCADALLDVLGRPRR